MTRTRRWLALLGALVVAALVVPNVSAYAAYGSGIDAVIGIPEGTTIRDFHLYVAPRVPKLRRIPLLIVLHGLNNTPNDVEDASNLDTVADHQDVALAYPFSADGSWNAGHCCGTAAQKQVDDVKFLTDIVGTVAAIRPIDLSRVYVVGFSNGAMMALRAICDRPDVFAAAASASGTLETQCNADRPISVLLINGSYDTVVPYAGSAYSPYLKTPLTPVPQTVASLVGRSQCLSMRETRTKVSDDKAYACSEGASIESVKVYRLGHDWATVAKTGVDGEGLAWSFLASHSQTR